MFLNHLCFNIARKRWKRHKNIFFKINCSRTMRFDWKEGHSSYWLEYLDPFDCVFLSLLHDFLKKATSFPELLRCLIWGESAFSSYQKASSGNEVVKKVICIKFYWKKVNFCGRNFRELPICEKFRGRNFRESRVLYVFCGRKFRELGPNSRKFLLAKISWRINFFP